MRAAALASAVPVPSSSQELGPPLRLQAPHNALSFCPLPPPAHRSSMKYLAAYLLAVLGGNATPDAAAVKAILGSVSVEGDDEAIAAVLAAVEGKVSGRTATPLLPPLRPCSPTHPTPPSPPPNHALLYPAQDLAELIAEGKKKLVSVGGGGGGGRGAAAAPSGGAAGGAKEEKKEEKKKEEEEEDAGGAGGLFGGDDDVSAQCKERRSSLTCAPSPLQ